MEKSLIREINNKTMQAYLNERDYGGELFFPNFFPFKDTPFLNYQTLIGSQGNPVAADIVTYDASSPLKSRRVVSKLSGSIPPTRIKKKMSEEDLNTYNILKAQANTDQSNLLDFIFNDIDSCVEGVLARMEWVALKALSQGYIELTKSNNDGIITAENIDFQMDAANKRVVKSGNSNRTWDNPSTAKPITDIEDVNEVALANGRRIRYILMGRTKFNEMRACTEVVQTIFNTSTAVAKPNLEQINMYLDAQGLPSIVIIDSYVDIEIAGSINSENCWNSKYVTFVPFLEVGNMLSGPIAAETNPPKQAIMAKMDRVLVEKFSTTDPVNEFTVGLLNAFPSFPAIDRCYRLDTEKNAVDGLDT